jgi:hypothetical protein
MRRIPQERWIRVDPKAGRSSGIFQQKAAAAQAKLL